MIDAIPYIRFPLALFLKRVTNVQRRRRSHTVHANRSKGGARREFEAVLAGLALFRKRGWHARTRIAPVMERKFRMTGVFLSHLVFLALPQIPVAVKKQIAFLVFHLAR